MEKPPPAKDKKTTRSKKVTTNNKSCTLGPVDNLEDYVKGDWWKRIFNSLYLKTDGDVINDQIITNNEVTLFANLLNLKPDDKILDLCCGQGRHSLELTRRGYKNVFGLDQSSFLIRTAKSIAKAENLGVQFKEGDARKLRYATDTFDVVMILGNSFGYFESIQSDVKILKEVLRVLEPSGRLLLDLTDGEYLKKDFQKRSWEWIDKKYFVCRERCLSADGERLISREVITDTEEGVIADQFYAERLYTKEKLEDTLQKAGFSDIKFHGEIMASSQRNQDLGMMERRILVSCVANKEWTPKKQKQKKNIKNVVVVMGDPKKIDFIKPDATFDGDDLYTINQLKSALNELKDYQFTYLNKHETLILDLTKLKGKIDYVYNLCDEGFNNEARKELHVPALLETLDIPYTGANPQCLAFCYDKSLVRGITKEMGIAVPEGIFIKQEDLTYEVPFTFPVIVKPNWGDNSFGITQKCVCSSHEELLNAISEIRQKFGYERSIIVEEFLTGMDISVGIIGNVPDAYTVLPITEEDYSEVPKELPRICGYEAKWLPDSPYSKIKSIPAQLPEKTRNYIIESCLKLFKRLDCRDYARFDWRLDAQGNPKLLEVNPNPGWSWDSHLTKMSKYACITYSGMHEAILQAAEKRFTQKEENGFHGVRIENGKIFENGNGVKINGEKIVEAQKAPKEACEQVTNSI